MASAATDSRIRLLGIDDGLRVGEPDLVKPIIALDIEHRFVCEVCGKRAADVRPDFNWGSQLTAMAANG